MCFPALHSFWIVSCPRTWWQARGERLAPEENPARVHAPPRILPHETLMHLSHRGTNLPLKSLFEPPSCWGEGVLAGLQVVCVYFVSRVFAHFSMSPLQARSGGWDKTILLIVYVPTGLPLPPVCCRNHLGFEQNPCSPFDRHQSRTWFLRQWSLLSVWQANRRVISSYRKICRADEKPSRKQMIKIWTRKLLWQVDNKHDTYLGKDGSYSIFTWWISLAL